MTTPSDDRPALLGGTAACSATWPDWPIHDDADEQRLLEVLRSGKWWYGDQVREFEAGFAAFQGAEHAVSCTNGTTALEMTLRGLGVTAGDEVIVPPYSFIATASAVACLGAIPVFADIDPRTLCIDPKQIQAKITERSRAIIPVHVGGRIADMETINAIAQEHRLAVLEDAAHAWGSQWQGHGAGTLGRGGTFSFQVSKNITAGEGGCLVTNDRELAELCRSFSHCGRTPGSAWYDHNVLGSNLRMTEFQAAVLLGQLSRLPEQVERRQANAELLDQMLDDLPGISTLSPAPEMTRRSYHMYIFRIDRESLGLDRSRLLEALRAEAVPATEGWYRPLYKNGVFQNATKGPRHGIRAPLADLGVDYREVRCPVCEAVCDDAVWIPQNVLLADRSAIEQVGVAIRKVVSHASSLA